MSSLSISHSKSAMVEVNVSNYLVGDDDVRDQISEKDPLVMKEDENKKVAPVSKCVRPIPKLMSISNLHEEILDSISESTEKKCDDLEEIGGNSKESSNSKKTTSKSKTKRKESQEQGKNDSNKSTTEINASLFMETMQKINPNLFMETVKKLNPNFFLETVQKILNTSSNLDATKESKGTPISTTKATVAETPDTSSTKKVNVRNCSRQFCPKCLKETKKSSQTTCLQCKVACIYECTLCKKICENYQRLFHHMRTKCLPKKNYQCTYCSYSTPVNHRFTRHVRDCHETIKTENIFECKVCGRVFKYQGSLKKHLESCKKRDVNKSDNEVSELENKGEDNSDSGGSDKGFNGGPVAIYSSDSDESYVPPLRISLNESKAVVKSNKSTHIASDKSVNLKSNKSKKENLDKSILAISNKSKIVNSEVSIPVNVNVNASTAGVSMRKRGRKKAPEKILVTTPNVDVLQSSLHESQTNKNALSIQNSVTETSPVVDTVADMPPASTTVAEKFTDITEEELNYRRKRHKIYIDDNQKKDLGITPSSFTVVQINEYSDKTYLANMINQYCPRCEITAENDANVKLYQTLQLCKQCEQPNLLQCLKCKKRYDRYAAMHYHMMSTCNPQKYYKCSKCDYTVTVKSSMLKHYRNRHVVDDNIYICQRCNTNFKTKVALSSHLRFCKKDMKLQCKLCDFKTIYHWSIRNHMVKVHHQQHGEFITNDSTAGTVVKSFDLSSKEKQQSNIVECYCLKCEQRIEKCETCPKCNKPTLFKCTICREEFKDPKNIKIHMYCKFKPVSQILSKKKSYHQCVFCKKKYTMYRTYQNHIKRCGKEPRFDCDHCSYRSLYKFNLRRHLDFAHNLGPNRRPEEDEPVNVNGNENESNRSNEGSNGKSNDVVLNEECNVINSSPIVNQVNNVTINSVTSNAGCNVEEYSDNSNNTNQMNNWAWNYSGNNYYNPGQGQFYQHSLFKM